MCTLTWHQYFWLLIIFEFFLWINYNCTLTSNTNSTSLTMLLLCRTHRKISFQDLVGIKKLNALKDMNLNVFHETKLILKEQCPTQFLWSSLIYDYCNWIFLRKIQIYNICNILNLAENQTSHIKTKQKLKPSSRSQN